MSNYVIYADDIRGKHITFREDGVSVQRLIADIPSFAGRYPGTLTYTAMIDCVNAVIDLMKNCVTDTATISVTGEAQVKFDTWIASDDNTEWELVPNSEFTTFKPYYSNIQTNKHFWGRRDQWTYVRTYRKIGSDHLVPWSRYDGVDYVIGGGNQFVMPESRADIEVSAFRLPVHKGADESKEAQKWLQKNDIKYSETYSEDRARDQITAVSDPGRILDDGIVIAPSDFQLYMHIPSRLYNQGYLQGQQINEFSQPGNEGLRNLVTSDCYGVPFYNWLVQSFSDVGDTILDPFCGSGASAVASIVNRRGFIGVEYNADRARNAQLACQEIEQSLQS